MRALLVAARVEEVDPLAGGDAEHEALRVEARRGPRARLDLRERGLLPQVPPEICQIFAEIGKITFRTFLQNFAEFSQKIADFSN